MRTSLLSLLCLLLLLGASASAQPEVTVGEISAPKVAWGTQTISVDLTNTADYPKWISTIVKISFAGTYLHPARTFRTNFVLEPAAVVMPVTFDMPMNYGTASMTIDVYDVVDTMDMFLDEQRVAKQEFDLRFHVPNDMLAYIQERITMPPMTENSPFFDSEFARIAFVMLREGKTVNEIAALGRIDTVSLKAHIKKWKYYGFLLPSAADSSLRPTFPIIPVAEAEAIKPLAEQTSTQLADLIENNLKKFYRPTLDSLVKAGTLTKDSNDFLNGGIVLYKTYPTVAGLLLWYDWGRGFIAGKDVLAIFEGTDPCNDLFPEYMYAVQGGDVFNGHHYFDMRILHGKPQISFADFVPKVRCPELYPYADRLSTGVGEGWFYAESAGPEYFSFDSTMVHPMLRALSTGAKVPLGKAYDDLAALLEKHETGSFTQGTRYWFWNLVATRTVDKLVEKKVIQRLGNGHYKVEAI